ncbi:MAG: DNA repair protein RecN [Clostridiales Family XIII bacterium]|jgi:DNA repair protein RecN (Recombination protein N)|nr:DNA repair protein RecN [Clostridiales Family XIII bacterium]
MITHILIRDFAIIENIDIDLHGGLGIITGETGAGKSIIIEAVSMALGARADTAMVRHGCDKALIQILIDESGIPEGERTGIELLSREISKEGKSVCRIDGEIVTLALLRERAAHIADIHGQYDHQRLLDPENHIGVIDCFRADYIGGAKARVGEAWKAYSSAKRSLDELLAGEAQSRRELDFVRYEVGEIDAASPVSGEYERLVGELKIMQNSERIYEALSSAYGHLSGELSPEGAGMSASEGVASAERALRGVSDISDEYRAMGEAAADAAFRIDELARALRDSMDGVEFSEQAINDTISRIDVLERLMSKYGKTIDAVIEYRDKAAARLEAIENLDEAKGRLAAELSVAESALAAASLELSRYRRKAAEELEAGVTRQLRELNFNDAVFKTAFAKGYGEDGWHGEVDPADFGPGGIDRIEFLLSSNKGQPPLPVARIASGGEMSRIMLALKSVIGEFDSIPTMIFDEIDAGISGITASVVGEKLKRMAVSRQIICITHLPQIAAYADSHYVIAKRSDDARTYTTVVAIDGEDRVGEVARLIGGRDVTDTTRASARELIEASGAVALPRGGSRN